MTQRLLAITLLIIIYGCGSSKDYPATSDPSQSPKITDATQQDCQSINLNEAMEWMNTKSDSERKTLLEGCGNERFDCIPNIEEGLRTARKSAAPKVIFELIREWQ